MSGRELSGGARDRLHVAIAGGGAAGPALWWPPAKIAGRYLGPFLATAQPQPLPPVYEARRREWRAAEHA